MFLHTTDRLKLFCFFKFYLVTRLCSRSGEAKHKNTRLGVGNDRKLSYFGLKYHKHDWRRPEVSLKISPPRKNINSATPQMESVCECSN